MSNRTRLENLLTRYSGLPKPSKDALLETIREAAMATADDMIALEEVMSKKRDWLDKYRIDERFDRRWKQFVETEVREHAALGEALERYGQVIGTRAFNSEVTATTDDTARRPLADDHREVAPRGGDGRATEPDAGVAISEPERPAPRQSEFGLLADRLRAQRIGR